MPFLDLEYSDFEKLNFKISFFVLLIPLYHLNVATLSFKIKLKIHENSIEIPI